MEERTDVNTAREEFVTSQQVPPVRHVDLHRAIGRAATVAGLALIAMVAMQYITAFFVEFFITPFVGVEDTVTGAKMLDDTSAAYYIIYFIQYFVMFTPPILIAGLAATEKNVFRLFKKKPELPTAEELEGHRSLKRRMLPEVLIFFPILLGSAYVLGIAATYIEAAFNTVGLVSPDYFSNDPVTPLGWVFYFLTLCVAAPVCEEMFFRGAVLNMLKPYGAGFAIACQAILFSVFHGTVAQLPYTLVGGLIFGYIAYRYGGILPTLLLHAINNAASVLISSCTPDVIWDSQLYSVLFSTVVYTVFIIGGLLLLKLLAKKDKSLFKLGSDVPVNMMEGLSAFSVFLTNPAVVVFFCLELGFMLLAMISG